MSRWDEEVDRLSKGRVADGKYVRVPCPACPSRTGKEDHKDSLSLNVESGWWRCWKCEARGRTPDHEGDDPEPEPAPEDAPPAEPLPEVYLLAGDCSMAFAAHREYLAARGLEERVWAEAGLCAAGAGRYAGRVIVPVVPGDLRPGFVARSVWPGPAPKYICPKGMSRAQLYNVAALDLPGLKLAVEGAFDALAHWPRAVAFLGKPTEAQVNILSRRAGPFVVVLDPDAWRESAALAQRLRVRGIEAGCVVPPEGLDAALLPQDLLLEAGALAISTVDPVRIRRT